MGHYLLQQVIVPPTEQMKSRDVLGISIATHTALVPRQHIQRFENPKFHAIFYGRGETTRRWGLGALLFGLFLLHHFAVRLDSGVFATSK